MAMSGPERLVGRRTLILGEVGAGKTAYTSLLLELIADEFERVMIIDMAPDRMGVGRPLPIPDGIRSRAMLLRPLGLRAPRLEGRTAEEVLELAKHNAALIEPLLIRCSMEGPPLLVINDLSIYLQAGASEPLVSCIEASSTFLGNSYYGSKLADDKGSGISEGERRKVEEVMTLMDSVIHLLRFPP